MKKVLNVLLIVCLCLCFSVSAKEKTLGELKAEAEANRKAYAKAKSDKELTIEEKNKATEQKEAVKKEISTIQESLKAIEKQIAKIQEDIKKKDKQMKEIMSFVQVSNGETKYMEYIFGATDFTDFIYRISVAEQLGDYNEELIEEYNKDVQKLDSKQKELTVKQQELDKKQQELTILEAKLSKEIEQISEGMESKDEEYKTQILLINNLLKLKCNESETMTQCSRRINPPVSSGGSTYSGGATTINANGLYMPIPRGYVTSGYGWRNMGGYNEFHTGVDISGTGWGSPIYPVAAGTVIAIKVNPNYGNHMVYINHNINGVNYTTSYWHMHTHSVYVGQIVSPSTVIGTMGGGSNDNDYWAPGVHVHLNLFRGFVTTNSGRIDPGTVLPIPSKGVYFTSPR